MKEALSPIRVGQGLNLNLSAVESLKVLNDKLLVVTKDGLTLEVSGLPSGAVDAVFTAYSRWANERHLTAHRR